MRLTTSRVLYGPLAILLCIGGTACMSTSWTEAQKVDTVSVYNQFLREHPDSDFGPLARERMEFLRVRNAPTIGMYEGFEREFPTSSMLAEARDLVEPAYFERARELNTGDAYRDFLARYPRGEFASRAEGNLFYVSDVRDRTSEEDLERFVLRFPESDFATEVNGTLGIVDTRRETAIRRLAVSVDVAADVDFRERVKRGFASVVARSYSEAGVEVVLVDATEDLPANVDARLRIDYNEAPAEGILGTRTLVSKCRVRLYHVSMAEPVWDRTFEAPAEHRLSGVRGQDKTIFGNARYQFWQEFFVPLARWATSQTLVRNVDYDDAVLWVDVFGDRAAVLLSGGGVDLLDVSTGIEPRVLMRQRRQRDLTRWTHIKMLSNDLAAMIGRDAMELIRFGDREIARVGRWEVGDIGRVRDVALYDETALVASERGLYALRLHQDPPMPHHLVERDLIGVAVQKPYVYLVGESRVDVAKAPELVRGVMRARMSLGKKFAGDRTRQVGSSLYVLGEGELGESQMVVVDIAPNGRPSLRSNVELEPLGRIEDVTADASHLYVVGDRGLQVLDLDGRWVSDQIQVRSDSAVALRGRFLLLAGRGELQVVDVSTYGILEEDAAAGGFPASPEKH